MSQYFIGLKILWKELESLKLIPTCQVSCNCDLFRVSLKYREVEHVICFLKGLNDTYHTIRTQILLMEPLPNINRVFSLLMQQEKQERQLPGVISQNDSLKFLASTIDKPIWKSQGRGTSS